MNGVNTYVVDNESNLMESIIDKSGKKLCKILVNQDNGNVTEEDIDIILFKEFEYLVQFAKSQKDKKRDTEKHSAQDQEDGHFTRTTEQTVSEKLEKLTRKDQEEQTESNQRNKMKGDKDNMDKEQNKDDYAKYVKQLLGSYTIFVEYYILNDAGIKENISEPDYNSLVNKCDEANKLMNDNYYATAATATMFEENLLEFEVLIKVIAKKYEAVDFSENGSKFEK